MEIVVVEGLFELPTKALAIGAAASTLQELRRELHTVIYGFEYQLEAYPILLELYEALSEL